MKIALGFTRDDLSKVVWTFVQAAVAFAAVQSVLGNDISSKAVVVGAVAAGISAVKNFVLADGSKLK